MGRRKAREDAFKCIYQLEFMDKPYDKDKILEFCFEENENAEDEKEYIETILSSVIENIDKIDEIILSNLKNWTISRIAKIDLAILRLSICELKFAGSLNTPIKVAINEAIELAKNYGNNDSKSFINGLLAKVIN